MSDKQIILTSKQTLAWDLLDSNEKCAVLFGGGKGGGKSVLFCLWVYHWVRKLCKFFDLQPSKSPLPLGFIGRKQGVDFRKTTLETFRRIIPEQNCVIRDIAGDQEMIFFDNRAKVYFGGLDDRKRINKFNSAEFAFIGVDQAEETERPDIDVLQGALRLTHNGKVPPYKQLYTANPGECWLKADFIDNPLPGFFFVPALHSDNPHLPPDYVQTLTNAFRYNAGLLDAYLNGNWYALQANNSLLSAKQIEDLRKVSHHYRERRGVVVCDPSLGGDACVIKVMENYRQIHQLKLYIREPMKIAGEMMVCGERFGIPNFAADVTGGLGEAILNRIGEVKPSVTRISLNYSSKEDWFKNGVNLRAEMAWHYMMAVIDQRIPYPVDEETRADILAMRFRVVDSNGHIILEPGEKLRETLGRSPDCGWAEIMGIWCLDHTGPIVSKDAYGRERGGSNEILSGALNAMTA